MCFKTDAINVVKCFDEVKALLTVFQSYRGHEDANHLDGAFGDMTSERIASGWPVGVWLNAVVFKVLAVCGCEVIEE